MAYVSPSEKLTARVNKIALTHYFLKVLTGALLLPEDELLLEEEDDDDDREGLYVELSYDCVFSLGYTRLLLLELSEGVKTLLILLPTLLLSLLGAGVVFVRLT